MLPPKPALKELHLIWMSGNRVIRGSEGAGLWKDEVFSHGPLFPGLTTNWKKVFLTSSCMFDGTEHVLDNVRFYLQGDTELLEQLAAAGSGIQISFDEGRTPISLTREPVLMPPGCIASNPNSTQIRPYDTAMFLVRASVPETFVQKGKKEFRIMADFEVV